MEILVISPGYIPLASVGKMRMLSLIKYLKGSHHVTVLHDAVSSYKNITDEKPLEDVVACEVTVKNDNFLFNVRAYKRELRALLNRSRFDVAVISVGPYYTLPLVKEIKFRSGAKVILDYRDLWSVSYRKNEKPFALKSWVKSIFFEKTALKNADAITCYSDSGIKMLTSQYPFLKEKRTLGIMNGYDEDELAGMESRYSPGVDSRKCDIYIYGKFTVYFAAENLGWFSDIILKKEKEKGIEIGIHQIGNEEKELADFFASKGVRYQWHGYMPYRDGMKYLMDHADVLLGANDVMFGFGTKIFDYIYLKRPILMAVPHGSELFGFTEGLDFGFPFADNKEFDSALEEILGKNISNHQDTDTGRYSRHHQNLRFESLICELTGGQQDDLMGADY